MDGLASLAAAAGILEDGALGLCAPTTPSMLHQKYKKRTKPDSPVRTWKAPEPTAQPIVRLVSHKETVGITKAENGYACSRFNSVLEKDKINAMLNATKSPLLCRWICSEFLYPCIDKDYFAENEFMTCLQLLNLGHIEKLRRIEWSIIRGIIGREIGQPRRLSRRFLETERQKLAEYRCAVRKIQVEHAQGKGTHAVNSTGGDSSGPVLDTTFPYQVLSPITVGDCVTVHSHSAARAQRGQVLTISHRCCEPDYISHIYRVQFENSALADELCVDTDICVHTRFSAAPPLTIDVDGPMPPATYSPLNTLLQHNTPQQGTSPPPASGGVVTSDSMQSMQSTSNTVTGKDSPTHTPLWIRQVVRSLEPSDPADPSTVEESSGETADANADGGSSCSTTAILDVCHRYLRILQQSSASSGRHRRVRVRDGGPEGEGEAQAECKEDSRAMDVTDEEATHTHTAVTEPSCKKVKLSMAGKEHHNADPSLVFGSLQKCCPGLKQIIN